MWRPTCRRSTPTPRSSRPTRSRTQPLSLRRAIVILPVVTVLAGSLAGASPAVGATTKPGVVATFRVPDGNSSLEINPRTGTLFAGNSSDSTITVVNERTLRVTRTFQAGFCCGVYNLTLDTASGNLYASGIDSGTYTINGLTHKSTAFPFGSYGAAYDEANDTTYLQAVYTNEVAVVRHGATRPTGFMHIGTDPYGLIGQIAVNPVTNNLYMAYGSSPGLVGLVVVNAKTNQRTFVPVTAGASAVAVNPRTNQIYVVGSVNVTGGIATTLTVFDGATLKPVAHLNFGEDTIGAIALNPVTNALFMLNYGNLNSTGVTPTSAVTVVNGNTNRVVENIPMSSSVGLSNGLAIDSTTGTVFVGAYNFVANYDFVSVIK